MSRFVKEILDFLMATVFLLLLTPLLACLTLAVWLSMGTPVVFRDVRSGYKGRPFTLVKFRTMNSLRDGHGQLLPDEQRLTNIGRLLRRFSLDEIPQLWNVCSGDMSLVGPRPLFVRYLERYTPEQARRFEVKPGITGWAQVNGRNALSWEDRFRMDVWYVDHWSLSLDARIIFTTILKVLRGEGISQSGHATMPEFLGSPQRNGQHEENVCVRS
jgi:sugar transferase EpsL